MNSFTLHGALMVPKCLRHKSQPKGILPLTTFHKVKGLFLETPCIFWEETVPIHLKARCRCQLNTEKESLLLTSLLPLCFCGLGRIVMGNSKSSPLGKEKRNDAGERE